MTKTKESGRGGRRPGSGRKKIPGMKLTTIRIDQNDWENIPGNKAEFVRQAVKEKIKAAPISGVLQMIIESDNVDYIHGCASEAASWIKGDEK